ncbi:MAG: hypothetical protein CR994_01870 [Maribacter sp.]|nr:MAG: hypothetical protein CR994_01870 [Maribacter sp.]
MIVFVLFVFLNKKWFKTITIQEEAIVIDFPLNIFGNKREIIDYDSSIDKVVYYGYMCIELLLIARYSAGKEYSDSIVHWKMPKNYLSFLR